ncbi:MAG TPA: hypothetical protein VI796_03035 [Candidatus Thermoplasmatota archaeon]|nr:hypothetical protein [Candidatus Thermoplasmatota archaeon]
MTPFHRNMVARSWDEWGPAPEAKKEKPHPHEAKPGEERPKRPRRGHAAS